MNSARQRRAVGAAALAAFCVAAGCRFLATQLHGGRELSRFPHDIHVEEQGMECAECHSTVGGVPLPTFPTSDVCSDCHDPEEEGDPAAPFFAGEADRWVHAGRQSEEILFDHARHAARAGCACEDCHGEVAAAPSILSSMRMRMDRCMACHEEAAGPVACASCHRQVRCDTAPASHREGWTMRHGPHWRSAAGRRTADRCDLCHTQGSCDACHMTVRPRSHNHYWRGRGHGVAAGIDRSRCFVCHGRDSCDRCHSRVRPRSHRGSFGAPSNRHCYQCHLPVDYSESCGVCHPTTPSHDTAKALPADPAHQGATPAQCRACHFPVPHPDSGDSCWFCHR